MPWRVLACRQQKLSRSCCRRCIFFVYSYGARRTIGRSSSQPLGAYCDDTCEIYCSIKRYLYLSWSLDVCKMRPTHPSSKPNPNPPSPSPAATRLCCLLLPPQHDPQGYRDLRFPHNAAARLGVFRPTRWRRAHGGGVVGRHPGAHVEWGKIRRN